MSRIERLNWTNPARRAPRSQGERMEGGASTAADLPVPVSPVAAVRTFREERPGAEAELVAHLLGQHGERRGLRAGPAAIDAARAAYNRVEWSGSYDRRARKGRQARTDI